MIRCYSEYGERDLLYNPNKPPRTWRPQVTTGLDRFPRSSDECACVCVLPARYTYVTLYICMTEEQPGAIRLPPCGSAKLLGDGDNDGRRQRRAPTVQPSCPAL